MNGLATSAAVLLLLAVVEAPSAAVDASEAATPVATLCAAEQSAQNDAAEVVTAVERIVACLEADEHQAAAALVTREFAATALGLPEGASVAAHLAGFFPFAIESIGAARTHADGRLSAEVVYRREEGQHMLVRERWVFVRQGDALLLDAADPLPVEIEGALIGIDARMIESGFALSRTALPAGQIVRFAVTNARPTGSDFAVFALPAGVTRQDVPARELPKAYRFIGAVFVAAGARGELVLVALEPGDYVVANSAGVGAGTPAGFTVR